MTLPFIFCSLVSNLRRVPDRPTRNNRLVRLATARRRALGDASERSTSALRFATFVRRVKRPKRSLKNRTVRPFFQTALTTFALRRLKSRAERRSFDVGLRSSATRSRSSKRKRDATKQKIRFSKMIGYTTISLESSGFLPFSPIFLNFLSK